MYLNETLFPARLELFTGEMTSAEIVEAQKLSRKYWDAFGPGLNTQ